MPGIFGGEDAPSAETTTRRETRRPFQARRPVRTAKPLDLKFSGVQGRFLNRINESVAIGQSTYHVTQLQSFGNILRASRWALAIDPRLSSLGSVLRARYILRGMYCAVSFVLISPYALCCSTLTLLTLFCTPVPSSIPMAADLQGIFADMSSRYSYITDSVEAGSVSPPTLRPQPVAPQPPCNLTSSPVSSLPTELLAHIFAFHTAEEAHVFTRTSPSPTWLALSQVSRRWRAIAIGYPLLWTHLNLSNRHWTAEMLARSKPLPITIHAEFSGRPLMHAIETALQEASRARQIRLSASIISRLIKPLRDQPAPLLESLELAQGVLPCVLPDDLFQGETPMLRSLKLNGMDIQWSSALLRPTLTHLEIRNTHAEDGGPQIEEMMRVLATMTSLQTLILVHALPGQVESPRLMLASAEAAEHRLPLPSLTKLHLSGTAAQCATFLGHVSIPLTTQLFVDCTPGLALEPIQPVAEIESMLAQHLSHGRDHNTSQSLASKLTPFAKLAISLSPEGQICLSAGQEGACQDSATTWQPTLSISLQWPPESPSVLYSELLVSRVCALLPLAEVKSLTVEGNMLNYGSCWAEVFAKMRHVEMLVARDGALAGFLEAFKWVKTVEEEEGEQAEMNRSEKTETEVVLFPGLKDLSIGTADGVASVQLLNQLNEGLLLRKGPIVVQGSR